MYSVQSLSRVSLRPHESQHARTSCPSPTPAVHSNSCPLSQWCHPAISSSVIPFSCPQSLPASGSSNESTLRMRWPKYWSFSFSISPSNVHPGPFSFRMEKQQQQQQNPKPPHYSKCLLGHVPYWDYKQTDHLPCEMIHLQHLSCGIGMSG